MGIASKPQVRRGFKRVGADVKTNRANIAKVDLESKVKTDTLSSALKGQQKRISRNEYALAASKVVDEVKEQFPDLEKNKVIKTALPLAPLLFLKPQKRGTGFESVITDPRVWAPILAGAAALYKETTGDQDPQTVKISPDNTYTMPEKDELLFLAKVYDAKNKALSPQPKIEWRSSDTKLAQVDEKGNVKTLKKGRVRIFAKAEKTDVEESTVLVIE
jgi:hypothetical protein